MAAHAAVVKPPTRQVQAFWQQVARCETGGNWRMTGPTYSGGVGFYNSTWSMWAAELKLPYRNAGHAPRAVQIAVADYGYRVHHGYWGTISNGCAGRYP